NVLTQAAAAVGMAQLSQRLCFDLPDALACHSEELPYLLQSALASVIQSESQPENVALARREPGHHFDDIFAQKLLGNAGGRRFSLAILDEISQAAVLFLADRGFQGDGLLRHFDNVSQLADAYLHRLGNLFFSGLSTLVLSELSRYLFQLIDRLNHVHRN